jgi:multiple sugar transport system substrate-binding protein
MYARSVVSRRELIRSVAVSAFVTPLLSACASTPPTPAPAAKGPEQPTAAPAPPTAAPAQPTPAPTVAPAQPTAAATATVAQPAQPTPAPTAAAAQTTGPIVLRWANFIDSPTEVENHNQIVDRYRQAKKKDVKVQLEVTSLDQGYIPKLIAQVASKTVPDLFTGYGGLMNQMAETGVALNLSPYLRRDDELKLDDFAPTMLVLGRYPQPDGDVYMLPRAMDVMLIFFNRDLFKQLQIPEPTAEWTWPQFYEVSRKLTAKSGSGPAERYGAGFQYDSPLWYQNFIYAEGGKYVSDDGSKATLDTAEAIRGMKLAWDGVKEGIFIPLSEQKAMGGAANAFGLGKIGLLAGARWAVPGLRGNAKFDWDPVVMPKGSVRRAANSGTIGYSLAGTTKTPDEAWGLLRFIYSPQGMEVLAKSYGVVPPVKQLYDSPVWRSLPPPPKNTQPFIDASTDAVFVPYRFFADTGAVDKAVADVFAKYVAGTPIEAAAREGNQNLQAQLDQYRQKKK